MKYVLAVLAAAAVLAGCHHDPPVHDNISTPPASTGQARVPGLPTASPSGSQADIPGTRGYQP